MNRGPRTVLMLAPLLLAGCAGDSRDGERTVFHNPYAPAAATQRGIGPECETTARASDATCIGVPLTGKGRGNTIGVALEDGQNLTRAQRRVLRERAELLKTLSTQPPITPPPPAPPPATPEPAETP